MDKDLINKLIAKYPDMFGEEKTGELKKRFIIYCGNGWFDIIQRLCEDIYAMQPKILQIKEKFGTLRISASFPSDYRKEGWDRISIAEEESMDTCERCGSPGEGQVIDNWRTTICKSCMEKIKFAKLNSENENGPVD